MKKLLLLLFLFSNVFAETDVSRLVQYLNSVNLPQGTVTDFTPHGTQPGLMNTIMPASNCNSCHAVGNVEDVHYTPSATWWGSMMANAVRDPLFWAAVDIANQDVPGVGDFCIRCHTPMGFYKGNTKDGTGDMDYANGCKLEGTVSMAQETPNNDYQGVTCHVCHRVDETGPGGESLLTNNSNIWLDDQVCDNPDSAITNEPCRKGPYNPPLNELHAWEYSEFIQSSRFCGTCHNVSSPQISVAGSLIYAQTLIDTDGTDTGIAMPVERTYAEWENSLFSDLIYTDGFGGDTPSRYPVLAHGQGCQECHMPNSDNPNARASISESLGSRAGNIRIHEFAGGNSWMPQVLKMAYGADLNLPGQNIDREAAFDRSTAAALDMLQNKSALVDVEVLSATAVQLQVKVRVTNLTGHKLPTGYPEGRRMWLNVTVADIIPTQIYESGAYNPLTAKLTEDADIKIYETFPGIWNSNTNECEYKDSGVPHFHFVQNNCIAKDTRIPPLGFKGGSVLGIKPVGITYLADADYPGSVLNYDETIYTIPVPQGVSYPLTVTATLRYQTTSDDYINFLENTSTTGSENNLCSRTQTTGPADQSRGAYMKSLWENNNKSAPVDMATTQVIAVGN